MLSNELREIKEEYKKFLSELGVSNIFEDKDEEKPEYTIRDCYYLRETCLDNSVEASQKGDENLSDEYLSLCRDFANLKFKYDKMNYKINLELNNGLIYSDDDEFQLLIKEFNTLYAHYKVLEDFR